VNNQPSTLSAELSTAIQQTFTSSVDVNFSPQTVHVKLSTRSKKKKEIFENFVLFLCEVDWISDLVWSISFTPKYVHFASESTAFWN
jgi:hypothetical protein